MAGLIVCAVAGFLLTNRGIPQKAEILVNDLPVIEQLDLYEDVGDVEFLKELNTLGPLSDSPAVESQNGGR
jgi:hypothetical protein